MRKALYRRLIYLGVVLCIIACMLVIACGEPEPTTSSEPPTSSTAPTSSSEPPTSSTAPTSSSAPPTSTAPPTTSEPTTTGPVYGGTLKLLGGAGQANIGDPALAAPPFNPFIPMPAVENLLYRDDAGEPVPGLVKSWEIDKDALTCTLYLEEGVKFHDGTPFNADAVIWNCQALIDSGQPELPNVASFEALDDYTVKINMSSWDILMANYFVLKAGNMISPTAVETNGKEWAMVHPVATGPFIFESYETDVSLKFKRFDDYWQEGKPYLDRIEWYFIADVMTRVASFKAGEGHLIVGLGAVQADELAKTGDYIILQSPSTIFTLQMDSVNEDSPWGNVLVRKAAAYAINNEDICEAFGYGYYEPTNQIGYPGNPMYNPNIQGYPYNPDKARELLADAGYPNGFDTTIWFISGAMDNIYLAVQGYWADVGINAEIEIVEVSRNIEISTGGWNNGVQTFIPPYMAVGYPPAKMITFYFSPMSPFSVSVMRPDDIEELRLSSLSADTVEEMNADIQEINRLLIDEYCLVIPIFVQPNLGAQVPWLHDIEIYDPWMEQWEPQNAWLEHE